MITKLNAITGINVKSAPKEGKSIPAKFTSRKYVRRPTTKYHITTKKPIIKNSVAKGMNLPLRGLIALPACGFTKTLSEAAIGRKKVIEYAINDAIAGITLYSNVKSEFGSKYTNAKNPKKARTMAKITYDMKFDEVP